MSVWTQIGPNLGSGGNGGYSVSYSSDGMFAVLGNGDTRVVKVYNLANGTWTQIGQTLSGPSFQDDQTFGHKVSISANGMIIAVGAWSGTSGGVTSSGYVKVYNLVGGNTWTQLGQTLIGTKIGRASWRERV